ncbi:MAG: glycosyltransferase family 4 protein [Gemmatimonadota bacterium]|nr:glycosyltransferase family 4 protein [Gemmatimonadota bacterium]
MILGLFTQLLTAGGIERVGRHTAVVLADLARARGEAYRVLSLNDPPGDHHVRVGSLDARVTGFGRSKRRFVQSALALARRATIAYFGHPRLAQVALLLRILSPRLRYWVHIHGVEAWDPLPGPTRAALRFATGIVSISRYTADRASEIQQVTRDKINLVPNALDPDMLTRPGALVGRPAFLPQHAKVLLTVARLAANERYKGVDTVVLAIPAVLRAVPDAVYVIIGDGDDRGRLERLAAEMKVVPNVLFVGHCSEEELIGAYRHCDVFVMPSRGEGFGVVFLEAMTFGKPVVAGAHGGAPEVVAEGETGFLVDGDAAPDVADRVVRLLTDEGLRARMGDAGRRRVETHFTFEHFRQRIAALLTDIPGARR